MKTSNDTPLSGSLNYFQNQGIGKDLELNHTATLFSTKNAAKVYFFIIAIIYVIFLFPSPEFNTFNKDDSSFFTTIGINLAQAKTYSADYSIAPLRQHATWPPGFPLFLAIVIHFFGVSWTALKLAMVAVSIANIAVLLNLFRDDKLGTIATAGVVSSPFYFLFSHTLMTEVPFMLMSSLALLYLQKHDSRKSILIGSLIASAAFLVRGYALAFVPAAAVFLITRKSIAFRERACRVLLFCIPLCFTILTWKLFTEHVINTCELDVVSKEWGSGTNLEAWESMEPPGNIVTKNLRKFYWYLGRIPGYFVIANLTWDECLKRTDIFIVSQALLGIGFLGWLQQMRSRHSIIGLWFLCTIFLLVVLPGKSNPRYWLMLMPFGLHYLLLGGKILQKFLPAKLRIDRLLLVATVIFPLAGLYQHLEFPNQLRFENEGYEELATAGKAIKSHSNGRDAVVITIREHGHLSYIASGLRSITFSEVESGLHQSNRCDFYAIIPLSDSIYSEVMQQEMDFHNRCKTLVDTPAVTIISDGQYLQAVKISQATLIKLSDEIERNDLR